MVGLDAVAAGIAAGHGDRRVDDIAVTAGSFSFDYGYFIACLDKSRAFHLKFIVLMITFLGIFYSCGVDLDIYYKTRVKKVKKGKTKENLYILL